MLLQLQRKADIPSAHTMMAIGCIPDTEPLSLGMIGMHGPRLQHGLRRVRPAHRRGLPVL